MNEEAVKRQHWMQYPQPIGSEKRTALRHFLHKSTNLPMKAVTFEFDSYTNHVKLLCSTI